MLICNCIRKPTVDIMNKKGATDNAANVHTSKTQPSAYKNEALKNSLVKENIDRSDALNILKPKKSANGIYSRKHIDKSFETMTRKFSNDPAKMAKLNEAYRILTEK